MATFHVKLGQYPPRPLRASSDLNLWPSENKRRLKTHLFQ